MVSCAQQAYRALAAIAVRVELQCRAGGVALIFTETIKGRRCRGEANAKRGNCKVNADCAAVTDRVGCAEHNGVSAWRETGGIDSPALANGDTINRPGQGVATQPTIFGVGGLALQTDWCAGGKDLAGARHQDRRFGLAILYGEGPRSGNRRVKTIAGQHADQGGIGRAPLQTTKIVEGQGVVFRRCARVVGNQRMPLGAAVMAILQGEGELIGFVSVVSLPLDRERIGHGGAGRRLTDRHRREGRAGGNRVDHCLVGQQLHSRHGAGWHWEEITEKCRGPICCMVIHVDQRQGALQ